MPEFRKVFAEGEGRAGDGAHPGGSSHPRVSHQRLDARGRAPLRDLSGNYRRGAQQKVGTVADAPELTEPATPTPSSIHSIPLSAVRYKPSTSSKRLASSCGTCARRTAGLNLGRALWGPRGGGPQATWLFRSILSTFDNRLCGWIGFAI